MPRARVYRWQVNHPRTSGGPKFSSLWEALAYIAHCIREGEKSMTIAVLEEDA